MNLAFGCELNDRGGGEALSPNGSSVKSKNAYFPGKTGVQTEHKKHYRTLLPGLVHLCVRGRNAFLQASAGGRS